MNMAFSPESVTGYSTHITKSINYVFIKIDNLFYLTVPG